MSDYKNLDVDKLLTMADEELSDTGRGGNLLQRLEAAKLILEIVALLVSLPLEREGG